MSTQEVSWSVFLREPSSIEPMLKRGDVVLKRRDGEPLRLSRQSRDGAEREVLATAARLIAPILSEQTSKTVDQSAVARLPWTRFLPTHDRQVFLAEFVSLLEACADLGDLSSLGRLLVEWKNTAALYADGLAGELTRPIGKVGDGVPRPGRKTSHAKKR